MALNKKGVFFTFLATVFVAVLVILYTFQQPQEKREAAFLIDTRVASMNDILQDINIDASTMLEVTTFRSLVAMEDEIANTGQYLYSVNTSFNELFLNGSMNGTGISVMANNTFYTWRDRMITQASKIGVALTLSASDIIIAHSSPWDVSSQFNLQVVMSDSATNTSWNSVEGVTTTVNLEDFEDPIYRLGTAGRVINTIVKTNVTDFVTGNDTTNLMIHSNYSMYRVWDAAPSLLQRFEGRLNESSPYGIESLVNIQELADAGVTTLAKSIVDYIYFSSYDPISCTTDHTPPWWQIDGLSDSINSTQHPYYYEVEGIINPGCT